jgi:hypothetical protein
LVPRTTFFQPDSHFLISNFHHFKPLTLAPGIFLLNQTLAFLTPKIDPAYELDTSDAEEPGGGAGAGILPMKSNEEFKPFIRRLPEFKFWYNCVKAILVAFFCTFFRGWYEAALI